MTEGEVVARRAFHTICRWFEAKSDHIRLMTKTTSSFEEWLNWEAFLACTYADPGFVKVIEKPSYGKCEVLNEDGTACREKGDLLIQDGPDESGRWAFFEFALLQDGNRVEKWKQKVRDDIRKLKRLPFIEAKALLFLVAVSGKPVGKVWNRFFDSFDVWQLRTQYDHPVVELPGRGVMVLKAFDVASVELDQIEAAVQE